MTAPHVLVIGAGVIGLLNAYALARRGARVTVVDARSAAAEGCSHANAGVIAVGHAKAWAAPAAIGSIWRGLGGREPGLCISKLSDPALWRWGLHFLTQCTPAAHRANSAKLQRLARYSRELMRGIDAEPGLQETMRHEGGLYLFRDEAQFADHTKALGAAADSAQPQISVLDNSALLAREPALRNMPGKLAGGLFSTADSVGDCYGFCTAMAAYLQTNPDVNFLFGRAIDGFDRSGGRVSAVRSDGATIAADAFVLATGTQTPQLTRSLGFSPLIYPVKGYSGTWPIRDPARLPRLPFIDESALLSVAVYDTRLRVTALAEFAGQDDLSMRPERLDLLRDYVAANFGDAVDTASATFWTGQRPTTPAGPPFLGRIKRFDNLWINAGHGQLGWTMAAGSGELLAAAMYDEEPALRAVSSAAGWLDRI
ncbi:FAD-dependent oxidoreductase [Granulosicoccaceae sp. 1_MG-2023]|nr:FAD-dependent oxidoreductase [Granulosicoccaceae sp. 1_MG-2023]